MNHEDVRIEIQEYLDGGSLSAAAREHLDGCPECAAYRERLSEVDRLLATDPVLAWTPEMTAGVVAGVRDEGRRRLVFGVAAAAVVVVAAWLAVGLVPEVPGIGVVGDEVAARVDLPASPAEAATRVVDGLGALFGAAVGALGASPLATGAPVAMLALLLLLLLNTVVAGRLRLAGRPS